MNDIIGSRYGRLVVLRRDKKQKRSYYVCQCDCGAKKSIRLDNLKNGKSTSCGCLRNELSGQRFRITSVSHGYYRDFGSTASARFSRSKLTPEAFNAMLASQGGVCAICRISTATHVDHNHDCCPTGKTCGKCIRGLLCDKCNQGLGKFNDSIDFLHNAIEYLQGAKLPS